MFALGTVFSASGYRGDNTERKGIVVPSRYPTDGMVTVLCLQRSQPGAPVYRSYYWAHLTGIKAQGYYA